MRKRSKSVRDSILRSVDDQVGGLVSKVAREFAISRQAVHKHIRRLVEEKALLKTGPAGRYQLGVLADSKKILPVRGNAQEDVVWRTQVREMVGDLPENSLDLWRYGFTEIFNNIVEHSESDSAFVQVKKTALYTKMTVWDRGVGIFNKIRTGFDLIDERHAVIELVKGKVTTDPDGHSGEGIFFTTRMFDSFTVLSGGISLTRTDGEDGEDWTLETQQERSGTLMTMTLKNDSARRITNIYENFSSDGTSGLSTTVVPAHLSQHGTETLVSRSEARRLMSRIDRFKRALVDLGGVESIGEAFADEVFRVFPGEHPGVEIREIRTNKAVQNVINGVKERAARIT